MKKFSRLSIFLALVMLAQLLCAPVYATQTEARLPEAEASGAADTIPENISGDASVVSGCSTIDAVTALMNPTELGVKLKAALMYEMNSETMLYGYNVDAKMYPASVTKVMTCLIALERGNIDDIVTVSQEVINNRDPDGSNCGLSAGEEMSLKNLLYCLMVSSANDAGSAISEHIAGSEAAFVELMNQKAQELGCTNTHFANPHGLHDENHYTCARDLAKILMAALEYDLFNEIYSVKEYEVPATNMHDARVLVTTNCMIDRSELEYYYDERVLGGKTGFTTPAGRCLVTVAESGDMKLLTVALGGETGLDENDLVYYGSFEETGNMLDYGFEQFTCGQILNCDAILTAFPVSGGANNTQAYVKESITTVVPKESTQSQLRYEYVLKDGMLTAPIEKDEELGVVRVWYQSKCLAEEPIYATVSADVKQEIRTTAPAIQNPTVEEDTDVWQIMLTIILALLALIVVMLLISGIRRSLRNARRARRRKQRGKERGRSR